ncbi:kinase [Flavisphingomonas formosensis]|uniref:kinase n=1 Tax=Flavisphingomonas formosensis TaxID=861534 RepID=UPI0012F99C00|nr:kinase [Sphingomonas formosensis]
MTESAALIADLAAERRVIGAPPHVLGLCGPQGSGKSTAAEAAVRLLAERGLRAAVLSLDDLYLGRAERAALAAEIHPLFATRGPPGTHDVAEGEWIIAALKRGHPVRFPRFDKIADDRHAEPAPSVGPLDVLIFEGWCIGAAPQDEADLALPVNALEAECDADALWRRTVNHRLATDYRPLFAALDSLVLLRAPAFEIIFRWRLEQEETNRLRHDARHGGRPMDAAAIERFIRHYERLTRHIDAEMPARADLVIQLDEERRPIGARHRAG